MVVFKMGLRTKVFLLSGLLLLVPLLTYQSVNNMASYLLDNQQTTLENKTDTIKQALLNEAQALQQYIAIKEGKRDGLIITTLKKPVSLDGDLSKWKEPTFSSQAKNILYHQSSDKNNLVSFSLYLGEQASMIYATIAVKDINPVMKMTENQKKDKQDQLVIKIRNDQGETRNYLLISNKEGYVAAKIQNKHQSSIPDINSYLKQTSDGYNITLRFPSSILGTHLTFEIRKLSNKHRQHFTQIISTSAKEDHQLENINHAPKIIKNIFNQQNAQYANITLQSNNKYIIEQSKFQLVKNENIPLKLKKKTEQIIANIREATNQEPQSYWFPSRNNPKLLTTIQPVIINNKMIANLIAIEKNNGTDTLIYTTLKKSFFLTVAVLAFIILSLFIFAVNLAKRIHQLRKQSCKALDDQGRFVQPFKASKKQDEIGDLSRSISQMMAKQQQYNHYLENLSSRLSHELRTPIAVTLSSIENLQTLPQTEDQQRYIARAKKGTQQLSKIITSMSEATRLEQTLQNSDSEIFPLNELVKGCVQGYQIAYPNNQFKIITNDTVNINADPDHIEQLLDKLISNAISFTSLENPIELSLEKQRQKVTLTVSNKGPLLPEQMSESLLSPMISSRKAQNNETHHLGLGLFIVKMISKFYKGDVTISNREDKQGVEVTVILPISLKP
jgi:dedicated sortase system histidine kinase